jgi:hypothetical protein
MTISRSGRVRAGGFASERDERGRRRSGRAPLAAALGPFLVASLAVVLVTGSVIPWLAGSVCGAVLTLWILCHDSPPPHVEDRLRAERRTARELDGLEAAGWHVVHDVAARYGRHDHVGVGPSGLFLVETSDSRALSQRAAVRLRVLAAAARLKEDLQERTGCRTWVQAVVVLWCDFPAGVVHDGRCVYVHGTRLRSWLEEQPLRFDPASVAELGAAVDGVAVAAGATPARAAG